MLVDSDTSSRNSNMSFSQFTSESGTVQDETDVSRQGDRRLELLNFIAAMHVWSLRGIKRDISLYAILCVFFSALLGVFIATGGNFDFFGKFSLAAIVLAGLASAYRLDARYRRARATRSELRQTTDEMRSLGASVPDADDIPALRQ